MSKKNLFTTGIIVSIVFLFFIFIYNPKNNDNNTTQEKSENTVLDATTENITEDSNNSIISIQPAEFKTMLDTEEYILIDIRTAEEHIAERIPGESLNIDFYKSNYKEEINKLDKTKKYLYYCNSGNRSNQSISIFKSLNFSEVYELNGGIINWRKNYNTLKQY